MIAQERSEYIKARGRAYYSANQERLRTQRRGRYWAAPEAARAATRRWHSEHREASKATVSAYYLANKDAIAAWVADYQRQYRKEHPGHSAIHSAQRRARCHKLPATLTLDQWEAIKAAYDYRCAYCGEVKPLTMDHVIPLTKGGGTTSDNIVPACKSCNSSKGAKLTTEHYQAGGSHDTGN